MEKQQSAKHSEVGIGPKRRTIAGISRRSKNKSEIIDEEIKKQRA